MVGLNGSGFTGGCMIIRNTFGACIAVLLLPQGGCSENRQSRNFRRTLEEANTGNAIASYRLARMYDHGEGAPEDDVEAYAWYLVLHESRQLSWHRDIIAKQKERLTAEQLTEAQKRATELLENYGRRN